MKVKYVDEYEDAGGEQQQPVSSIEKVDRAGNVVGTK